MNDFEKERNEFILSYRDQFEKYLADNGQAFSLYHLREFSKNVLWVEYEQDPKGQATIKAFLKSYEKQIATELNGDRGRAVDALKSIFRGFPNPHVKGWGQFLDSVVNFDDSKDFKSRIFNRRFPAGTISYIGARPGRGKTTALVNIALDALDQGKPVIFVTAEETTKQILTRFILSRTYSDHPTDPKTVYNTFKPRTSLFNYMKDRARSLEGAPVDNGDFFGPACDAIGDYVKGKKLTLFEAYGATWQELAGYLADQEAGALVLIDYIQHLKSPDHLATQTRQIQIQEISHQLADLAGLNNLILICGAQFNRETRGGAPDLTKPDLFDETSFREAGDIEQDGHILIGIGKAPETEELFYSCMKDREASPDNGKCWKLKKNLAFSYLRGDTDGQGNRIEYASPVPDRGKKQKQAPETEEQKKLAIKNYSYGGK